MNVECLNIHSGIKRDIEEIITSIDDDTVRPGKRCHDVGRSLQFQSLLEIMYGGPLILM